MKLKHFITLVVLASLGAIIYGFNLEESQEALSHKFIGSGTLGLFLIAMPLFLYKESKKRDFKDYMLTDENVRKMQGKPPRKSEDS
ncbi:hypothetical protein [Maribacter sp. 2308TA10-17]|uniref:hypothetical protein n=1 Tax=Maribacter sp. 2308TA10-17 TaxID=3386276 RepID=UPI0039BD5D52